MRIKNPVIVDPGLLDPSYVCYCPEHKLNMRKTIYGKERMGLAKKDGIKESCFHSMPYAGETPPKWMSTFDQDFTRKSVENESSISAQAAMDANKAHFSLASTSFDQNDGEKQILSTTKRDYVAKELTNEMGYSNVHFQSSYPPIFLDKQEMKTPSDSVYRSQYTAIDPRSAKPSFHMDRTIAMKTNINFGNDRNPDQYISVTHAHIKPLPQIEPVAMIRTDRKKSNVLDNPDGEVGGYDTTQKTDYTFNKDIDRNSLIVDNKAFMKDLKMTHFQMGTNNEWSVASQYNTAYRPHPLPYRAEKMRHSDTDDVDLRDDRNGGTESSTNKTDFIRHQLSNTPSIEAGIIKAFNNHPSVSLRSNEKQTPQSSVTRSDYIRHAVDKMLPPSGNNMAQRERENVKMFDEGYPCEKYSTAQANYVQPQPLPGEGLHRVSKRDCVALRSDSHFTFGSNPILRETTTNAHYGTIPDPSAYSYPKRISVQNPPESLKLDMSDREVYTTTSRQSYQNFGINPISSKFVRAHGQPAGFCLGNGQCDKAQMITANQRTYLPPEMLKFPGPMPLACPVCNGSIPT